MNDVHMDEISKVFPEIHPLRQKEGSIYLLSATSVEYKHGGCKLKLSFFFNLYHQFCKT